MESKKSYQSFISELKIKHIRAQYNGDKISSEKYKNMYKQLEAIRERRHLSLIGEKREENIIYSQIADILNTKDIESEEAIDCVQNLLNNTKCDLQKKEEKSNEEMER